MFILPIIFMNSSALAAARARSATVSTGARAPPRHPAAHANAASNPITVAQHVPSTSRSA
jgi:hypothetical protein